MMLFVILLKLATSEDSITLDITLELTTVEFTKASPAW